MTTVSVCTECGSKDIEGMAMATINDPIHFVDWSVSGDPDECFCNECDEWTTFEDIDEAKYEENYKRMHGEEVEDAATN